MASYMMSLNLSITHDLTEEEYQEHWSKVHAKLAAPWLAPNGILKYIIYHTPSSERDKIKEMAEKAKWDVLDHDGHVELWIKSLDDVKRAVQDAGYLTDIFPDEHKMLDKSRTQVTIGWQEVKMIDGKIVDQINTLCLKHNLLLPHGPDMVVVTFETNRRDPLIEIGTPPALEGFGRTIDVELVLQSYVVESYTLKPHHWWSKLVKFKVVIVEGNIHCKFSFVS
ncbi:hypothetical protein PROFUN_08100 [Planoprotostelium fungivorum]|uniref:EthD domain-containing protein n=1 Tax=Planoprotostelium fungivorum TaxID=1890364 RepID=A0A2P6NKC5_9EUKA|nr:hypothetical protein PROFUN_08100 [Planoprotostelium fungivorum]